MALAGPWPFLTAQGLCHLRLDLSLGHHLSCLGGPTGSVSYLASVWASEEGKHCRPLYTHYSKPACPNCQHTTHSRKDARPSGGDQCCQALSCHRPAHRVCAFPFYRGGNWPSERVERLAKVSQLGSCRAWLVSHGCLWTPLCHCVFGYVTQPFYTPVIPDCP